MESKEVELSGTVQTRSALTEKLLRNARKSLNEISELTGLDTKDLAERYAQLFEDRGWLTERQEERLLIIELGDFISDAQKTLGDATMDQYAAIARVVLQGFSQIADRFDKRKKLVEDEINQITLANAKLFGQAFDLALQTITDGLMALHPDIKLEEIMELTREGLALADRRLQANVRM